MHNSLLSSIGVFELFGPRKKNFCFDANFSKKIEQIGPKIILLQGPVGPFFKNLRHLLEKNGFNAWRICFNAGDTLYSDSKNRICFYGDIADWRIWLKEFIKQFHPEMVIFFGSEREIHRVAKDVADEVGVKTLSLEEGYIRPGYVTVEEGGNNAHSPLARAIVPQGYRPIERSISEPQDFQGLVSMCISGAVYYVIRSVFSYGVQKKIFHRQVRMLPEAFCWIRNCSRKIGKQSANLATIHRLLEFHDKKYVLIPLQVAADGQLGRNALNWNSTRLIAASMKSFAETAPCDFRLVFKIHPMERGHCNHEKLITDTAAAFEIYDRVDIISVGSLGLLARHAARMVTINSTAGLSAIFHGTPLLVIGKALYAHKELATCAMGKPDFTSFWSAGRAADLDLRKSYLMWVREQALVAGDFYASSGIEIACNNILRRLEFLLTKPQANEKKEMSS